MVGCKFPSLRWVASAKKSLYILFSPLRQSCKKFKCCFITLLIFPSIWPPVTVVMAKCLAIFYYYWFFHGVKKKQHLVCIVIKLQLHMRNCTSNYLNTDCILIWPGPEIFNYLRALPDYNISTILHKRDLNLTEGFLLSKLAKW
jgi:hypothetical protein